MFARPSPPSVRRLDRPGGEGLAARLLGTRLGEWQCQEFLLFFFFVGNGTVWNRDGEYRTGNNIGNFFPGWIIVAHITTCHCNHRHLVDYTGADPGKNLRDGLS